MNKVKEECGVFAIANGKESIEVASTVFLGLFALQHRGQEGVGISINRNKTLYVEKDLGLVGDVFSKIRLEKISKC